MRVLIGRKPHWGVTLVILALSGCQSAPEISETSPAQTLRLRAEKYTAACVVDDWATLYNFHPPAYREKTPQAVFVENNQKHGLFRYNAFDVRDVEVQGDYGWVKADCETRLTKFPLAPPRKTSAWEKWRRLDGVWYPCSAEEGEFLPMPPCMRDADEERRLEARFWEYEAALEAADHETLFTFFPPENRPADEEMIGRRKTIPVGCEVEWVEVAGNRGRIRVEYLVKLNDPSLTKLEPRRVPLTEKWTNHDGTWYRDVGP